MIYWRISLISPLSNLFSSFFMIMIKKKKRWEMRSISRAETESCRSNLRSAVPDKSRDSSRPENINFRLVVRQRTFVFLINNDSVCATFNLKLGLKRLFRGASEISDNLFLPFKAWQGYLLSSHKLLSPIFTVMCIMWLSNTFHGLPLLNILNLFLEES